MGIEVIVAVVYTLVCMYACFTLAMRTRVKTARTTPRKVWRVIFIALMLFGAIMSGVFLTEAIVYVIDPTLLDVL